MRTNITLAGGDLYHVKRCRNTNHRKAYRAVLTLIQQNAIIEGSKSTHIVDVSHECENYTKIRIKVDGRAYFSIMINTYKDK